MAVSLPWQCVRHASLASTTPCRHLLASSTRRSAGSSTSTRPVNGSTEPSQSQPLARSPLVVFDTSAKAQQKARAAIAPDADQYDYLRDEIAARVVDRVCDMSRTFPRALDLYCGSGGHVIRALEQVENKPGIQKIVHADLHEKVLRRAQTTSAQAAEKLGVSIEESVVLAENLSAGTLVDGTGSTADTLAPKSMDLVISSCGLHWVNDLPGVLTQANHLLKPDGLFIGAMMGGDTLQELRIAMQLAEQETHSGISPHVSPMIQLSDAGSVLGRAGFRLTTIDIDEIRVPFKDMRALMRHLKRMGEGNAVRTRRPHYGRKAFHRAAELYEEMFGYVDNQGRPCIPATFQIVHMVGWAPADASVQPQPMPRGSGTASFADLASKPS